MVAAVHIVSPEFHPSLLKKSRAKVDILGLKKMGLDPEGSHFFMDTPSANVGLEVSAAVLSIGLFSAFGEGAALGSILGTRRKVAKSA